jgi:hypothetical protein
VSRRSNCLSGWLQEVALVEPARPAVATGDGNGALAALVPRHCVLLRAGGVMSVLDLLQGARVTLCQCA